VTGPLADKFLCYAMLEAAKDAVREYKTPVIQPATPEELMHIKGNGKVGHG
jgi:spore coat protein CotF